MATTKDSLSGWHQPGNNIKKLNSFVRDIKFTTAKELLKVIHVRFGNKFNFHIDLTFSPSVKTRLA